MFTLVIQGKTRNNPAESNHVLEMPPTPPQPRKESGAVVNDQERLLTSQEKTAASRPRGWATDCNEVLKKEGEKKDVGEERRQNGIIRSLAKMKLTHQEGRGIYIHNFTRIKSLCQICDVLW